jgi:hypothetical protein
LGLEQPPRTKRRYFAEKMSRCIPKVPYRTGTCSSSQEYVVHAVCAFAARCSAAGALAPGRWRRQSMAQGQPLPIAELQGQLLAAERTVETLRGEWRLAAAVEAAADAVARTGQPYAGTDCRIRSALANGGALRPCIGTPTKSVPDARTRVVEGFSLTGAWEAVGTAKDTDGATCEVRETLYLSVDSAGLITGGALSPGDPYVASFAHGPKGDLLSPHTFHVEGTRTEGNNSDDSHSHIHGSFDLSTGSLAFEQVYREDGSVTTWQATYDEVCPK